MKHFLQKSGIFILILFCVKLFSVGFFEEGEVSYKKKQIIKQDFNTVFIGSSRTGASIVPAYFDLLTHHQTKSFNFGIAAGMPPNTFIWCKELIETKSSLKYIFFELSGDAPLGSRFVFWKTNSFTSQIKNMRSVPSAELNTYISDMMMHYLKPTFSNIYADDFHKPLQEIYKPKESNTRDIQILQKIQFSHSLNREVEKEDTNLFSSYNENYWNNINELLEFAESKQVSIYFFIPPRLGSENELEKIYPIYQRLDRRNKINVAHYDDSLYQMETSFDLMHLNYNGAMQFTKLMAEAFNNGQ